MKYGLSFDLLGAMEKGFGKKLSHKIETFLSLQYFCKFLQFLGPFLKN